MAKTQVIGLDIGSTAVRAAQVEFSGKAASHTRAATLVRYGEVPIPLGAVRDGEVAEPEIVAHALQELWSRAKFDSKDVVLGVGNQRVVVRDLSVPAMPVAQIKASLPFQVQELLPMPVDDALLDFLPTGSGDGEHGPVVHGLLVAAVRQTVSANVLSAASAGLSPTMVDLNALAILRAMSRGQLREHVVALVDIGARVTNVVIADRGVPKFVRVLPSGGQDVTDAVARTAGISAQEAENLKRSVGLGIGSQSQSAEVQEAITSTVRTLVEAIRSSFVYYASNNAGHPLEGVVLTGGGGHLPGLGQYLATSARVAVSFGDPLETVTVAKSAGGREAFTGRESLLALPLGLAQGVAA